MPGYFRNITYLLYRFTFGRLKRYWLIPRIPRKYSPRSFLSLLTLKKINYVLLRWPEKIIRNDNLTDVDILVADESTILIEKYIVRNPFTGGIRLDIFSTSGMPGYNYKNMAYFPPHVANQILKTAIISEQNIKLPSPINYYKSLLFHLVYHKSKVLFNHKDSSSFNSIDLEINPENSKHLKEAQNTINKPPLKEPITLRKIHQYLKNSKWSPPLDMLLKLSINNYVLTEIASSFKKSFDIREGLIVFIIRDNPLREEVINYVISNLPKYNFKLLSNNYLTSKQVKVVSAQFRGGNWGGGSFTNKQGGSPYYYLIVLDKKPTSPPRSIKNQHPLLESYNAFIFKNAIRNKFNSNIIHSSDSFIESTYFEKIISNN